MAIDPGFELLPADDDIAPSLDERLNAAVASALRDPEAPVAADEDDGEPTGYTWAFDFEAGRFTRQGGAPARVTGLEPLKQRCLMALHSARFAHAVFSVDFGMERPRGTIGAAGHAAVIAADDWRVKAREALLTFEDVADVELRTTYDALAGAIIVSDLVVTTNEDVEVPFEDVAIPLGEEDLDG